MSVTEKTLTRSRERWGQDRDVGARLLTVHLALAYAIMVGYPIFYSLLLHLFGG